MNSAALRAGLALLRLLPRVYRATAGLIPPKARKIVGPVVLVLSGVALGDAVSAPPPPAVVAETPQQSAPTDLQWLIHRLSERVPPDMPVDVRMAPLLQWGYLGKTYRKADRYLIILDSTMGPFAQRTVLIHEWAHTLSFGDGHGPEWGLAMSKVFRAYLGEYSERTASEHIAPRNVNLPQGAGSAPTR